MVDLNNHTERFTIKHLFLIIVVLIVLLACCFAWMVYGVPVHDLRLWLLERQFSAANIHHPDESVLLGRRSYLGLSSYKGVCEYATGEVRHVVLSKEDILKVYKDIHIGRWPLEIYFTDESDLPYDVPFSEWQNGLETTNTGTRYIIFTEAKHDFLWDLRCYD